MSEWIEGLTGVCDGQANAFQQGWGQTIFQSANEMMNRQVLGERLGRIQKEIPAEKERWERQREAVREGFMRELDGAEKPRKEAAEAKERVGSDEDGVLVEKGDGSGAGRQEGGKKKKKKGKK